MRALKDLSLAIAAIAISAFVIVFVLIDSLDDGNSTGITQQAGSTTITTLEPIGSVDTPEATTTAPTEGGVSEQAVGDVPDGVSSLVATLDGGLFHLTGTVPDVETAEHLVMAAFVAYGPAVTTAIDVDPEVAPSPWLEGASQGLTLLPMITEGTIRAVGDQVELTGFSPNEEYLALFEQAVAATYGVEDVTTDVVITNLTPPHFNARYQNGVMVLSGELPSEEIHQIISGGAAAVYGPENVDDRMTIGAGLYTSYWMYTMPAVFRLLGSFPDYEINVENGITTGSLNDGANFASGSAELNAGTQAVLDIAVAILVRDQSLGMIVEGHTDSVGSRELNQRLSESRAAAAIAYLEAAGIDPARLSSVGYGEDRPIASNDTAAGKASNRRVAFAFEQRVVAGG